jgi:hypothetical protein
LAPVLEHRVLHPNGTDLRDATAAGQERWKLVADFEASDLTQREFASERGVSFSNLRNGI